MRRENLYISSIDSQAEKTAAKYGLGLEIAEYCTAYNMDLQFAETDRAVREKIQGIPRRLFHGPFNELFPCAVDPKARELAAERFRQALGLAKQYGAEKVVFHGGFHPLLYYPSWYVEQSVLFWRSFLPGIPEGITICLENVLENDPEMMGEIMCRVNDPRLRLCLDVGHANAYSGTSPEEWLSKLSPWLEHFHIHNNVGSADTHSGLREGTIPMASLLTKAEKLCPEASFTLEISESEKEIRWLLESGLLEE